LLWLWTFPGMPLWNRTGKRHFNCSGIYKFGPSFEPGHGLQGNRQDLSQGWLQAGKSISGREDSTRFPDLFEFPLRAGRMLNQGFVAYLKQSGLQTAELPLEQGYLHMEEHGQTLAGWIDQARGSA
jgi:hypothetical protein